VCVLLPAGRAGYFWVLFDLTSERLAGRGCMSLCYRQSAGQAEFEGLLAGLWSGKEAACTCISVAKQQNGTVWRGKYLTCGFLCASLQLHLSCYVLRGCAQQQAQSTANCITDCTCAGRPLPHHPPALPVVARTLQGDSALVLDALMYRRGISSKEISVSYHKACQLLTAFEHVDFQFIPRWVGWGACKMSWRALQVFVASVYTRWQHVGRALMVVWETLSVVKLSDTDVQGASIMPISGVVTPHLAASFLLSACCLAVLQGAEQPGQPAVQDVDGHRHCAACAAAQG
jgi:hypothetical protein